MSQERGSRVCKPVYEKEDCQVVGLSLQRVLTTRAAELNGWRLGFSCSADPLEVSCESIKICRNFLQKCSLRSGSRVHPLRQKRQIIRIEGKV